MLVDIGSYDLDHIFYGFKDENKEKAMEIVKENFIFELRIEDINVIEISIPENVKENFPTRFETFDDFFNKFWEYKYNKNICPYYGKDLM